MQKKAIIVDLDNTIYLVSSIGDRLFKTLFQLITESGEYKGDLDQIKSEIMRTPFQKVADAFHFGENLKAEGIKLLADLTYEDAIDPVESYDYIRKLSSKKFLVTKMLFRLKNKGDSTRDIAYRFFTSRVCSTFLIQLSLVHAIATMIFAALIRSSL